MASTSTVIAMVSVGAPQARCASAERLPDSPVERGAMVRCTWSGLYWNTTTRDSGPNGSTAMMAPRKVGGLPEKLLTSPTLP
ncbi:hypothetical protein [Nonomuraea sp. B5E05]|uniref:hypothetical protein n=1 Tax=Nonomuraea sp. B5E05 TaxID=3153569 RepID=UPI003261B2D5